MKPSSSKPTTAAPHIPRPAQRLLRRADLQPIPSAAQVSANGKPLISPLPNAAELAARRKSERLEIASTDVPVRNSTVKGPPYTCPELRTNPHRPGSADAYRLPSRTSFRNPQPA